MAKKPVRARTERRAAERAVTKLADARERLATAEPGGDPARPLRVDSSSQIEPHALSVACARCGGSNRLLEHAAVARDGEILRVARMRCGRCGSSRELWFRIAPTLPN
jgi:ribosomal protein S27AE